MRLEYRIHWVDDSPDFIPPLQEKIKRDFHSEPIEIITTIHEDGGNIEEISRTRLSDLYVFDYQMEGVYGDELIKKVRGKGDLTEVIFYSADPRIHEKCPEVHGVQSCSREDASGHIKTAIAGFIARSKNLSVMRGMVISEAIEVENRLTEIILEVFSDQRELFRVQILNKAYMDFEKKRMFLKSVLNERLREERKKDGLDSRIIERMTTIGGCLEDMKGEIVNQRNILAHSEKKFVGEKLTLEPLKKGPPIIFDHLWVNSIRKNITKHMKNLEELREILTDN